MADPSLLAGRHALVTGGGSGIGAGIARALKASGARVTILGRTEARLLMAVEQGVADAHVVADVTDADALERAFRAAGSLDIVVANAGQAESAPLKRADRAMWDRLIAVDLTSVFDTARLSVPAMAERGHGRFIAIASIAGLTGLPYVSAYCAAKHGVVGFVKALGKEYARTGVTVNAICPGYVETDLVEVAAERIREKTGLSIADAKASMIKTSPLGRFIQVDEVAAAVVWLSSDAAASVTGTAIPVAGGEVA